ncbi:MAG: Asp-tRNA(Asn)/Glu-tRNA(Gln) amidotransferase subunit GatB [Planctomycetota bacterium]
MQYETVIGLETHAHFLTRSKMFCGCRTAFGAAPNTQTCPVCQGLPGVLPVVNRHAVELGLRTAVALRCKIAPITQFDRKNYYYPDLPKNYQISQNYNNLGVDGRLEIEVAGETKEVGIWNVHLEEDAGKLEHPEDTGANYTAVDLNRAGTPLLEIVSAPDLRSAAEANAYMTELAALLRHLDISDCKMEEGSLRFEAGISVRPAGSEAFGNRVEVKNLNSMSAVVRAIEYEQQRQIGVLESGGAVPSQTMLWNVQRGATEPMRSKEEAKDYRYFPEPDLVPIEIGEEWLERIRKEMPELPSARRKRFIAEHGLPPYDAGVLVEHKTIAQYFEDCVKEGVEPKTAANWIMGEVMRELNERKCEVGDLPVSPPMLAELIGLVTDGRISNNVGKDVFSEMCATGKNAAEIVEEKGLAQISDSGELESVIRGVLDDNPDAVADLKSGRQQAKGFLIGQVMRATKGKANPKLAGELIDGLVAD